MCDGVRGAGSEGETRVHGLRLRGLLTIGFRVAGYGAKGLWVSAPFTFKKKRTTPHSTKKAVNVKPTPPDQGCLRSLELGGGHLRSGAQPSLFSSGLRPFAGGRGSLEFPWPSLRTSLPIPRARCRCPLWEVHRWFQTKKTWKGKTCSKRMPSLVIEHLDSKTATE